MKVLGNIIWHFPCLGFLSAMLTYLLGLLLTVTVVAAPIGLGLMELGKLLFWPFGNTMVKQSDVSGVQSSVWNTYSKILTLIYLPIGIVIAFLGTVQVVFLFFTVVGIPVAMVIAKSLSTYINPVGKKCVSSAMAEEIERSKAQCELDGLPPDVPFPVASESGRTSSLPDTEALQAKLKNLPKKPLAIGVGVLVAVVVLFKIEGGTSQKATTESQIKNELAREIFRDDKPKALSVDTAAIEAKAAAEQAAKEKALADQAAAEKIAIEKAKAEADAKAVAEKALADKQTAEKLAAEKLAVTQQEEAKKKAAAAKVPAPTAAPSQLVANTPKPPNSAIVDGMLKDGTECFAAKRFDCAITQAKSALRVDPSSAAAKSLMQKAKSGQQAAMDAIEIR